MRNAPRFARLIACAVLWVAGCTGQSGDSVTPDGGGGGSGSAGAGGTQGTAGSGDTAGTSGSAGAAGTVGGSGTRGGAGGTTAGRGGAAGTTAGRGGATGTAGRGGAAGTTAGRGGAAGTTAGRGGAAGTTAGRGGAAGTTAGRGGAAGTTAGRGGNTGTGGTGTGMTALGAHTITYFAVNGPDWMPTITSPAITTRATGSAILVGVARGNNLNFSMAGAPPTDNKGNPAYPQIGPVQPGAPPWQTAGAAQYALLNAIGGAGFQVHTISGMMPNNAADEVTMSVVEVTGATRIQDYKVKTLIQDNAKSMPVTSDSVTTTGPATIVAVMYPDTGFDNNNATITVNNGFQVIDKVTAPGSVAQAAVAARTVTAAGSYNVTWTITPAQGAQMWMFAVE